jgi:hypothetical protein
VLAWLLADPRTPDLAAQLYRVRLFEAHGFAVFDEHWYAGHSLPGYGLLFTPLASLIGMRALAALAAVISALLFERIARGAYGSHALVRAGACVFAIAAAGDLWSGRLTFALGVTLGLGCALALARSRPAAVVALLAALCAAASPVAGALLVLAALTLALARRSPRVSVLVGLPVALVLAPLQLLFGEGGYEPFPTSSFVASTVVVIAFLWALPRREGERLLRIGAVLYLLACLLALVVLTPMGSNIERYAVLLAGPLLLCSFGEAARAGAQAGAREGAGAWRAAPLRGGLALGVILTWVVWGPARETLAVAGSAATSAPYYTPLERYLQTHGGTLERVEVPLTRSHWEAALLAPRISLARGWEKQLDELYDGVLLGGHLTASSYYRWLRDEGVSYVALPDAALDPSSAQEGRLIRAGLPYLTPVFDSAHWRVYAVRGALPLLAGPGRLTSLGHEGFSLRARAAGTFLVRVHRSRYFTLTSGNGCVASAPGGWTYVHVRAPGEVRVAARFSFGRALGLAGSCRSG